MKSFIKRTIILLLIGMVPGVVAANQPDPITLLRRAKSLGSLSSLHTENVLKASSHLQQTVSRAMKASIDYTPMQPDMQMPFLTSTFQARITGKERANCFSGTVFQIDYEGQKEIYGVVAAHTIASSERSYSLQKNFTADVYNGREFVSIPAQIVQLSAPGFLDMALVKFRPEDEKLFTPLTLSTKEPSWADMLQTQGFASQRPVFVEHRMFMGQTPFSIRTNMPWPREDRPGLCGGAVINDRNKLVGIHTGSFYARQREEDDIGYLTPARFLGNLVEAYHHNGISKFPIELDGKKLIELNVDEYVTKVFLLNEKQETQTALKFPGKFSFRRFKESMENISASYIVFVVNGVFWESPTEEFILDWRYGFPDRIKTYIYDVKKGTTTLMPTTDTRFKTGLSF